MSAEHKALNKDALDQLEPGAKKLVQIIVDEGLPQDTLDLFLQIANRNTTDRKPVSQETLMQLEPTVKTVLEMVIDKELSPDSLGLILQIEGCSEYFEKATPSGKSRLQKMRWEIDNQRSKSSNDERLSAKPQLATIFLPENQVAIVKHKDDTEGFDSLSVNTRVVVLQKNVTGPTLDKIKKRSPELKVLIIPIPVLRDRVRTTATDFIKKNDIKAMGGHQINRESPLMESLLEFQVAIKRLNNST